MTTENLISDTNTSTNPVDQLVGEGKKFQTVEDLAKGKLESDQFIQTLKDELALARAEINSRARLEEILERIEDAKQAPVPQANQLTTPPAEGSTAPDINKLIDETITRREAARTASQNNAESDALLKKYFGDNYQEKVKAKAEALKLDLADINAMARKSPTALMELLGLNKGGSGAPLVTPPTSSVTTERMGFTPNAGGARDWAYYENVRKTNKTLYNSPEFQMQLHNDAIAAANRGENFGI